jgi:type I restriction enzyme, S subunit
LELNFTKIPLPPLEEQKRIAAILDQADALRRLRQRSIDRLNSLGQAIFYEMFGDPVNNPMGWPIKKLGDIGNLDRGVSKHRPRNDPKLLDGNHPLIQTGDISNADRYVRTYNSTYSDLGLKQSKIWPTGTLCITIAANIGKTAILGFDACFPDSVVGFTPKAQVNTEYVQYWMDFIQKRLEEVAPQSAQKNINLAILRDLPIPVPPREQQNKFRDILFEIEEQKTHFGKSEQFYINFFASLQHQAFNGELSE